MINVTLNTNTGKGLLSMMFGVKVAMNNIQSKIVAEQKAVIQAANTVLDQRPLYDMRYNATKDFFKNPLTAKNLPVIKQTEVENLKRNTELIYKNLGRITSYNNTVSSIKNNALMKGLRSNL